MGHDITAFRPNVDREELRRKLYIEDIGKPGWSDRFDDYCRQSEIASNRRSAGNPLNQVLYLVLGVMDEAYAGCSGLGVELNITLDQFKTALKLLEAKNFEGMEREPNMADKIVNVFQNMGIQVFQGYSKEVNVDQEKEFCRKCIEWLEEHEKDSLVIDFG